MKLLPLFGLMFSALITAGQKNDYVWLAGYDSGGAIDTALRAHTVLGILS